jgi:hypothetical protein
MTECPADRACQKSSRRACPWCGAFDKRNRGPVTPTPTAEPKFRQGESSIDGRLRDLVHVRLRWDRWWRPMP